MRKRPAKAPCAAKTGEQTRVVIGFTLFSEFHWRFFLCLALNSWKSSWQIHCSFLSREKGKSVPHRTAFTRSGCPVTRFEQPEFCLYLFSNWIDRWTWKLTWDCAPFKWDVFVIANTWPLSYFCPGLVNIFLLRWKGHPDPFIELELSSSSVPRLGQEVIFSVSC